MKTTGGKLSILLIVALGITGIVSAIGFSTPVHELLKGNTFGKRGNHERTNSR